MKKYYLPVVSILMFAFIWSSFSGASEVRASESRKVKASVATKKPIVIKFASFEVPNSPDVTKFIKPWLNELEKRCGGKIVIKPYWSESLVSLFDAYQAVEDKNVDMAMFMPPMIAGKFPLDEVMNLSPLNSDVWRPSSVYWDLFQAFPEMQNEYSTVKLIGFTADISSYIGTNKPIHSLEDNKGLKMLATGSLVAKFGTALGWTMVTIPPLECYSALERGIVDGMPSLAKNLVSMKFAEVIKYLVRVPAGRVFQAYIMNRELYESLPMDVQVVFDEMGGEYLANQADRARRITQNELELQLADMGMEFIDIPSQEIDRWNKILDQIAAQYATELNKKGFQGDKLLEKFYALCAKYSADEYAWK